MLARLLLLASLALPAAASDYPWTVQRLEVARGIHVFTEPFGHAVVSGNVVGPIKPASFSGPCVGTAADVVDEGGRPVRGAVGELVIRAPMPGMTRGFWGDTEGRYEATYWSRFPGAWVRGDWASIDADGYVSIGFGECSGTIAPARIAA